MKKKKNWFMIIIVTLGVILFGVVAFVVVRSTRSVKAVVPNQNIPAGTRIESDMLTVVDIPYQTPSGFITDKSSLIGQKLKTDASPNQLMYINNIITSWDDVIYGASVPDDYIITAIQLPSYRAVGGLITAGDVVDILGIPGTQFKTVPPDTLNSYLGDEISYGSYGTEYGINLYWVLANVLILEADSTLSDVTNSTISMITSEEEGSGAYYIVALSYDDYLRLQLCSQYMELWMNIAPSWNAEHGPMIDRMTEANMKRLTDSMEQSALVEVKDGEEKEDDSQDGLEDGENEDSQDENGDDTGEVEMNSHEVKSLEGNERKGGEIE